MKENSLNQPKQIIDIYPSIAQTLHERTVNLRSRRPETRYFLDFKNYPGKKHYVYINYNPVLSDNSLKAYDCFYFTGFHYNGEKPNWFNPRPIEFRLTAEYTVTPDEHQHQIYTLKGLKGGSFPAFTTTPKQEKGMIYFLKYSQDTKRPHIARVSEIKLIRQSGHGQEILEEYDPDQLNSFSSIYPREIDWVQSLGRIISGRDEYPLPYPPEVEINPDNPLALDGDKLFHIPFIVPNIR